MTFVPGEYIGVVGVNQAGTTSLDFWEQPVGYTVWRSPQYVAGAAESAAATAGSSPFVAAVDSGGNLWSYNLSGTQWVPDPAPAGMSGATYSSPQVASTSSSRVMVATDNSGDVEYWWEPDNSATWTPEEVAAAS
jgi:hypothetical protein